MTFEESQGCYNKEVGNDNALLIGGHRKSGTTMLYRLFDGHEQIFVSPTDLNVLYAYYPEWSSTLYSPKEQQDRLRRVVLEEVEKKSQNDNFKMNIHDFEKAFVDNVGEIDTGNIWAVVNAIVYAYRQALTEQKKWIVVKETTSEIYAPNLLTFNSNWKFLHLARDPRDNYAAIKAGLNNYYSKLGNDYIDTLGSLLIRYAYGIKWLRWNIKQLGLNRYYLLRFEDLAENTELEMEKLTNFLGVQWSDTLLTPTVGSELYQGNSHEGIKFSGVDTRNIGKWQDRIDYEEAALIEFILSDEMEWLGYQKETDPQVGAKQAAEFYAHMNYKYFFADRFS